MTGKDWEGIFQIVRGVVPYQLTVELYSVELRPGCYSGWGPCWNFGFFIFETVWCSPSWLWTHYLAWFFFFLRLIFISCAWLIFFCIYLTALCAYVPVLRKPEEGAGAPETRITCSHGCWESILDFHREQSVSTVNHRIVSLAWFSSFWDRVSLCSLG